MRRETTEKRKEKFKEWFKDLGSEKQLRTLACLMRLKDVRSFGRYEEEIRRSIFRVERKRGNSELLRFFAGIEIGFEFKELSQSLFNIGRIIRGHKERRPKVKQAGICGAAIGGAAGILTKRKSYGIIQENKRTVYKEVKRLRK